LLAAGRLCLGLGAAGDAIPEEHPAGPSADAPGENSRATGRTPGKARPRRRRLVQPNDVRWQALRPGPAIIAAGWPGEFMMNANYHSRRSGSMGMSPSALHFHVRG
jgi:hypothetical protein